MDIADKTLELIEGKKIRPLPKWRFQARSGFLWFFLSLSLAAAAMAIATIIFIVSDYDWEINGALHKGVLESIFYAVPYFWLGVLVFFIVLAYYDFRSTRKGYRYNVALAVGGTASLSLVAGILLFYSGLNSQIHDAVSRRFPAYGWLVYDKSDLWNNAEKGFLGGSVIDAESSDSFIIRDPDGVIWRISGNGLEWFDPALPKAGVRVRLTGRMSDGHSFAAETVKSWK